MTNQINPLVRISLLWTRESAIKHIFIGKPLLTNECKKHGRWKRYQILSFKPPWDVTKRHWNHHWIPPTTRRKSPIYRQCQTQKEVRIHFYPHITKSELLPLLLFLSYLTLPLETQWLTPHRWPLEWKFSFCSCAGHLTTLSDILSRWSPRLTILASSLSIHMLNFVSIDCSLKLQTHLIK